MLNFDEMTEQKNTEKDNQEPAEQTQQSPSSGDAAVEEQPQNESVGITPEEASEAEISPELEAAQAEIVKLKDAFLRAKAEEDNVRRRAEKEVANSRKFAVEGFSKEMLGVFDSLKLAVTVELADDVDETVKSVHEGVNITLKQLQSAFSKFSIEEISPEVGDKLDPNLHQAMSMVESDEVESGCIINVIQAGFQLHDRLLRPAMVVVAK